MWVSDNTVSLPREYFLEPVFSLSGGFFFVWLVFYRLGLSMEREHFSPKMLKVLQGKVGSKRERKRKCYFYQSISGREQSLSGPYYVLSSLCCGSDCSAGMQIPGAWTP